MMNDFNTFDKIRYVEYMLFKLKDWYNEVSDINFDIYNDFSKLKILKLHYFITIVEINKNGFDLLDIFNKFRAMPYGTIEDDVYYQIYTINNGFTILNNKLNINNDLINENYFLHLDNKILNRIDININSLKNKNRNFILYSGMDMINLNQKQFSWSVSFELAKVNNKLDMKIPIQMFENETKYYILDK